MFLGYFRRLLPSGTSLFWDVPSIVHIRHIAEKRVGTIYIGYCTIFLSVGDFQSWSTYFGNASLVTFIILSPYVLKRRPPELEFNYTTEPGYYPLMLPLPADRAAKSFCPPLQCKITDVFNVPLTVLHSTACCNCTFTWWKINWHVDSYWYRGV